MEDFVVSARKYRPATFDSVVGQSSITTTLKNAIKSHHLAQAFLFCGPRGVGKTTCARILAKTINCFNISEKTEACNECESCKSFDHGHSLNVYELDAASNNSVDDIRNLVDQVRFAPQLGKYKVYIVDEVHMLSASAFNAFLKTLEEPPKHAIFILATTEKHKIIPTILSRCQIFDFHRIQIEDIAKHLAYIAQQEDVAAEPDALHLIAQKADGALRDACSIFDQIVSFAGSNVTYKAVIDNLNILDYDYYFKVTDAVYKQDIPNALLTFNEILDNGFDGHNFIAGLGEHFRNILVCKDAITLQLLEVGANIKEKYKEQSITCPLPFLLKGLGIINRCDIQYKNSKNQRLQVELALLQLCSLNAPPEPEKKNELKSPEVKEERKQASPPSDVADNVSKIAPPGAPASAKKIPLKPNVNSINQFINPAKTETKQNTSENYSTPESMPAEAFATEDLESRWKEYSKIAQLENKINVYTTLTDNKPFINTGNSNLIEFTVMNKVQEEAINEEKMRLLSFLREKLNNHSIQLNITINKNVGEKRIYTSQDKFNRMAEKNPTINKLKQQFDLEIDF